jgi:hypothetical protein
MNAFALPDAFVVAPLCTFEFDPAAPAQADVLLAAEPVALYRRLLRDQESEAVLLAARRVLHGFLSRPVPGADRPAADPDAIAERVAGVRAVIMAMFEDLPRSEPAVREAVLRQRAPLALLGGCWLDTVSQPATQPATIANRLFQHQFVLRGEGNPRRGLHHLRARALEAAGVYLPEIGATDFMRTAEARPLTALHGAFYLSLAKLPANFLPEVVGVHYAVTALGVDELLLGMPAALPESELRSVLGEYLDQAADRPELGARVVRAVELALALELEHVGLLARLAAWRAGRSPELSANRIGERAAAGWRRVLALDLPADVLLRRADVPDDRQFFHRLVNIENYPNTRGPAREHATVVLDIAEEVLFEHGAIGMLTDASWFEYTPEALLARVDRICRDKLSDEAAFGSKSVALGSMVDGAWTHRIGTVGRYARRSDGKLYSTHAEALGRGDPRGNEIAMTYRLLGGMGIRVPHIRDAAFLDQEDLPEHRYELAIQQLSLSLFPDTCHDEILGFNLGIATLGLGLTRARKLRRLRRHWIDAAGEDTPAPVECTPAGQARHAAEVIIDYLDEVAMTCGSGAVRTHWRRIWRGYASFAYLVEQEPLDLVSDDLASLVGLPGSGTGEQSTISVRR